ncbi:CsbD family protein [Nitrospira tepida]|uniref:CsbD family protein n=1 Tax=Nitrospira tepida TaxID=2973512 RepID=UPI00259CE8BC|nr:CsbD family protein [Nitrospira tepida]
MDQAAGAATTVVNKDQFQGNWKQFKGEVKKQWGELTDDDLMQIEGDMDKFEGKVQERYGDRKEEVKRWTDEWFEKRKQSGTQSR